MVPRQSVSPSTAIGAVVLISALGACADTPTVPDVGSDPAAVAAALTPGLQVAASEATAVTWAFAGTVVGAVVAGAHAIHPGAPLTSDNQYDDPGLAFTVVADGVTYATTGTEHGYIYVFDGDWWWGSDDILDFRTISNGGTDLELRLAAYTPSDLVVGTAIPATPPPLSLARSATIRIRGQVGGQYVSGTMVTLTSLEVAAAEPGGTLLGSDVDVATVDPVTGETPATVSFDDVLEGGTTSVATSPTGPPPPTGFKLGTPPIYYELFTTAVFAGSVQVCIDYSGTVFKKPETLRLFHDDGTGWADITTSNDLVASVICGTTTSLSPFTVAEANDPETDDDCKHGGWEEYGFRNQGQCVRFAKTGKDSR